MGVYTVCRMDAALNAVVPSAGATFPAPRRVELGLEGMTCAACAARIEKSLNRVPGAAASVNFANETATARLDEGTTVEQLIAAVESAGYHAFVRRDVEAERRADKERKAATYTMLKREVLIATLLTLPLLAQMLPMLWQGQWFGSGM